MFPFFNRGGSGAACGNDSLLKATVGKAAATREPDAAVTTTAGNSCGACVPGGHVYGGGVDAAELSALSLCDDSLESWCRAHGLNDHHRQTLEALGTTSYLDFIEMDHDDKQTLIRGLNLELVLKNKVLAAVEPEALALFHECATGRQLPFQEYHARSAQRVLQRLERAQQTPLFEMATASSSTSSEGLRDWFPPSIQVPPHKIVVVDKAKREKALHDNPVLNANEFMSFRTDPVHLPPGATVKVILVVGRHKTGKSAVINSFVNHLYGIRYEDKHRLRLILEPNNNNTRKYHRPRTVSKTNQVVGYLLESPPAMQPGAGGAGGDWVLIVDTPGFEDGRGLAHDESVLDDIKTFFTSEIKYVNAVWFVNQSSGVRQTVTQKWMYENVNSLFSGRDEDTTSLLFTFCDTEEPPALEEMENAGIHSNKFYKLNNTGFVLKDSGETSQVESTLNMMFWEMSNNSFRSLVELLLKSKECPMLTGQKSGISLREQLGKSIEHAWREVEDRICKLISLEQTIPLIVRARSRIEKNRFEVETLKYLRVRTRKTESGGYSIICDSCQCTCVDRCFDVAANEDGSAPALTSEGLGGFYCTSCPVKCHLSNHRYVDHVWDLKEYKLHKKIKEIRHRYVKESSSKSDFEQIMNGMRAEFHRIQNDVYDQVNHVQGMVSELEGAALPPDQFLSEYAGLLSEQKDVKDRKRVWKWRLGVLENGAKYIDQIADGSFLDPYDEKFSALVAQATQPRDRDEQSIQTGNPELVEDCSSIATCTGPPDIISQE